MTERFKLIKPTISFKNEILAYKTEFGDRNKNIDGSSSLNLFDSIEEWLIHCQLYENQVTLPNKNFVPCIQYMLVEEESKKIIGFLHLRLELNDSLRKVGGHIGYSIAPSERKKGYATYMLSKGIQQAKFFGISKILITCDTDNIGSAKVIMNNGGILENKIYEEHEKTWVNRYWIHSKA